MGCASKPYVSHYYNQECYNHTMAISHEHKTYNYYMLDILHVRPVMHITMLSSLPQL